MKDLRIGVTSTRRSQQLSEALRGRGATVVLGPMLSGDVPAPDEQIVADTRIILAERPAWVVATSAIGMRLWVEAADRAGLGDDLRDLLTTSRGVARGAKPVAGFANLGVQPVWVSEQETDADVASWLAEHVGRTESVAVQLHGGRTHAYRHLTQADVEVLTVLPYTSGLPLEDAEARELIAQLVAGALDVVTFTSPTAARNLFAIADTMGPHVRAAVAEQLSGPTAAASIGPVTSEALESLGAVVAITPRRYRTGALLRSIERWADQRRADADAAPTPSDLASLDVRLDPARRAVVIAGHAISLGPREYQILATMVRDPGAVFRAEEFVVRAWGHQAPADPTLVRNQVGRLRRKLDGTPLRIETVRGVGYRLSARVETVVR